ncbi:MAG: hypothetical protein LKJ47_00760 [Bifidobacteriaceae bacterium]|jgi:hypothetical protein|nr:hypothetical protein [Bifidobacteriaceae bacterium]
MSRYLNLNQLVTVADSMMCGNADLAWLAPEDFKDYLDTHRWFQGRSKCLRALTLMEAKTDSPQETYLRLYLQASGITPLLVNPVVRGWNKTWKVDLVHPPSRCIFEYDGRFHNSDSQQWARDPEKRQDLEHADWRVFNITSQMLSVPEKKNELTSSIMATIVERMSSTLNR